MIGSLSIIGNDLLCTGEGSAAGAPVRIPLTAETLIQLRAWTAAYRQAVRYNDPPALFALGQALFAWLDATGWATAWSKGTGPRVLEVAVDETDSPAATLLLDLLRLVAGRDISAARALLGTQMRGDDGIRRSGRRAWTG